MTSRAPHVPLLAAAAFVATASLATTARASDCYVAFIHGSGDHFGYHVPGGYKSDRWRLAFDRFSNAPWAWGEADQRGVIESYWRPPGAGDHESLTWNASRMFYDDFDERCTVFRVGYNGFVEWYDPEAADVAAEQLAMFIDAYGIPDKKLVIVTHSMGGLVARYILNHALPHSPRFRDDFARVAQATRHVVTIQAPHGGSRGADALFGEAGGFPDTAAGLIVSLGMRERDRRSQSMTTSKMYARILDGTMNDGGRTVPLYTIAGETTKPEGGAGMEDDANLSKASQAMCYVSGPVNNWGGFCGPLCFSASLVTGGLLGLPVTLLVNPFCNLNRLNFREVDGSDGLVEHASAHGLWPAFRNGDGSFPLDARPNPLQGPYRNWLTIQFNHNHGRYNRHAGRIRDLISGSTAPNHLGTYIGHYGHRLPESTMFGWSTVKGW